MNKNTRTLVNTLRAVYIKRSIQRYLLNTVLIALWLNFAALAIQRFTSWQGAGFRFYLLLIILAAGLSLLHTVRSNRGFKEALISLDKRLKLKELLSTWHEYRQSEPGNPWTDKLEEQTNNLLKRIAPARAFPRLLTTVHLFIPLVIILSTLLLIMTPVSFKADAPLDGPLIQLGIRLERATERMLAADQRPEESLDRKLAEEMAKLAGELKTQKKRREELFQLVRDLKLKIEKDSLLLSRKIEEELGLADVFERSGLERDKRPEKRREELERLEEKLNKAFQHELPVSLSRNVRNLNRFLELEELLDEAADEMGPGLAAPGSEIGEEGLPKEGEGILSAQEQDQDISEPATASQDRLDQDDGQSEEDSGAQGRSRIGLDRKGGNGEGDELLDVFDAGKGTSSETSDGPADFDRRRGPIMTEKHDIEAEDPLTIHVRSLPIMKQIQVTPEEIIREYRRESEAVLNREDIPLTDREIVRNYFISIGLRKE